jgi:hypothetical protein
MRMATRGPLPRLRNTIIELVMAASVLPHYQNVVFYLFIKIQRLKNMVYMEPYAGVDYNLTLCPLQSRLQHIYHGQPYVRVDLDLASYSNETAWSHNVIMD